MLTQKQNAIRVCEVLTGKIFSGWNCHFLVRGGSHLLKETLDTVDADSTQVGETTAELLFP